MKKEIIKYPVVFFTLIAVFFTYSVLVCLLPTETIKKNVTKSVSGMVDEGHYPRAIINKKGCQMDNFTDVMFLSQNYAIDNKKPIVSVIHAKHALHPSLGLLDAVKRQVDLEEVEFSSYPRYWHGNSFLLRPFLLFADYSFIRWFLYTISSILFLILGIKMHQTLGMKKTVAFMLGLLCVNIFVAQFSIQFFTVIALSVIASILMCKYFKDRKKILLISFIFGCMTSYFDLLTAPLLTCGLPLLVYLSAKTEDSFKKRLSTLFLFAVLWGMGYGFTWASKWVLGTLFTDINVIKDAFDNVLFRSSNETNSRLDAIIINFNLLPIVAINLILTMLLPLVVLFFNKNELKTNLLLLIVAIFPYLWLFVVAQHSWWHWWFTYRIQAISIIAIFFIFINFISWDKVIQSYERCKTFFQK